MLSLELLPSVAEPPRPGGIFRASWVSRCHR